MFLTEEIFWRTKMLEIFPEPAVHFVRESRAFEYFHQMLLQAEQANDSVATLWAQAENLYFRFCSLPKNRLFNLVLGQDLCINTDNMDRLPSG